MGESLTSVERADLEVLLKERDGESKMPPCDDKEGNGGDAQLERKETGITPVDQTSASAMKGGSSEGDPLDTSNAEHADNIVSNNDEHDDLNKVEKEHADSEELRELLDRFDRGEEIDEDRLYELELLERHRMGESLTSVERADPQV